MQDQLLESLAEVATADLDGTKVKIADANITLRKSSNGTYGIGGASNGGQGLEIIGDDQVVGTLAVGSPATWDAGSKVRVWALVTYEPG